MRKDKSKYKGEVQMGKEKYKSVRRCTSGKGEVLMGKGKSKWEKRCFSGTIVFLLLWNRLFRSVRSRERTIVPVKRRPALLRIIEDKIKRFSSNKNKLYGIFVYLWIRVTLVELNWNKSIIIFMREQQFCICNLGIKDISFDI